MKTEKTAVEVKIHELLVCACKSEDFVQSLKKFARSHDHETVTFRKSVLCQFFFYIISLTNCGRGSVYGNGWTDQVSQN